MNALYIHNSPLNKQFRQVALTTRTTLSVEAHEGEAKYRDPTSEIPLRS